MDNPALDPYDNLEGENVRRNSADYETLNITPDDNVEADGEKINGDVTFSDTKVTLENEGLKQRPPTGRKAREIPLKPYAGMNKEDLLRFSNTPFWNRLRMGCLVFFWLCWLGLLAAVIALTIVLPRCSAPPVQDKWQSSVYYQIYVRSFADSNGDGIGDINGVTSKLDYLQDNDIDAIVLSSIYSSHETGNPDFGYDVIDHTQVSTDYGTLDDFRNLLEQAHERDISVLLDFIPGQTGNQHPWFVESEQSTSSDDPYRNYYVWADAVGGSSPNNWLSLYDGEAWQLSGVRNQYVLSQFLSNQPQLNLRSTLVRQELENILRFWLDLGVDGFKVINGAYLYADYDLQSEPPLPGCTDPNPYDCLDHIYTKNQDESFNVIASWRHLLDEYSDRTDRVRVLLTDSNDNINNTVKFYGQYGATAANIPMNYLLRHLDSTCNGNCVEENIREWIYNVPAGQTSNWATTNQDLPRNDSSLGINIVNLLTFTLPGGALFYYGDELGLINGPQPATAVDPVGIVNPALSRDPFRTPMPWSNQTNGGFTNQSLTNPSDPWLPVYTNYDAINVEVQEGQRRSALNNFRRLSYLRHEHGALQFGEFQFGVVNENVLSYIRSYDGYDNLLVVANVGQSDTTVDLTNADGVPGSATLMFSSDNESSMAEEEDVNLRSLTIKAGHGMMVSWPFSRPSS